MNEKEMKIDIRYILLHTFNYCNIGSENNAPLFKDISSKIGGGTANE